MTVGCDSCPGVDAEHHLCDVCLEEDRERERRATQDAVDAETEACIRAIEKAFERDLDVSATEVLKRRLRTRKRARAKKGT